MTAIAGALIFALSAFFWGREKARHEEEKILLLASLISFVAYTEEQITNFKTPLAGIYLDFSDPCLEKIGFIEALRKNGAEAAIEALKGKIPEGSYKDALAFAGGLGRGYSEGQKKLCDITLKRLEKTVEELKADLSERVRMYRLLPVLVAASVIILLI